MLAQTCRAAPATRPPPAFAPGQSAWVQPAKSYAEALLTPPPPPPKPVLGRPPAALPISQLTLGRATPPWYGSSWKVSACEAVGDVLRVRFPRGSGAFSRGGPPGGVDFKAMPRGLPSTDATLKYKVRFAPGFDWSRGGKLPGMFIGDHGGASGGVHSATASSARIMWRRNGLAVAYVYLPTGVRQSRAYHVGSRTKGHYGDEVFGGARLHFRAGEWNNVTLRVKLNGFDDEGSPRGDGTLTLGLNGKAATMEGIVWRADPAARVHHIAVTSFFGGTWKSPVDTYLELTDFALV